MCTRYMKMVELRFVRVHDSYYVYLALFDE